jgi:hypothetical protein
MTRTFIIPEPSIYSSRGLLAFNDILLTSRLGSCAVITQLDPRNFLLAPLLQLVSELN